MRRRNKLDSLSGGYTHGFGIGVQGPSCFFEQDRGWYRAGDGVNHESIGCEEMCRNVPAILLNLAANLNGPKITNLLMRGNEVVGQQITDPGV